jgi:hypothetical protein
MLSAISHCRGSHIVLIDSDGQFRLNDIDDFLPHIEKDPRSCITGRRISKKDSFIRVAADRCLNIIVRTMFGTKLNDTNCALKLLPSDIIKDMHIDSNGYSFPTEICLKLSQQSVDMIEVNVSHDERRGGKSSLKVIRTGIFFFLFLIYLKLRFILFRLKFIREP